jgi:carboxymethylenebutenolidase
MIETQINIPTRAGSVDTFITRPDKPGPWPGVIFYMDAPGIREELRDMARRIATVGYCVLLPNLYYRHGHGTVPSNKPVLTDPADRERMYALMNSLSNQGIAEDTCMSGPFVAIAGSHYPERFAAIASFYGVGMATDKPDSPHLNVGRFRGEAYICYGETDELTPPEHIERFKQALNAAGTKHSLEVYPGVGHGFAFPARPKYDKPAAERHWERLFDLFGRTLRA